MTPRLRRVEKTADTRRRLLDAARRVFLRHGFAAASLEMVVAEAGLTKGAVYSRFRSKADLFLALLEERIATRIGEMEAAAASQSTPLGVATALSRQWDARLRTEADWSLLAIEFRIHAARVPQLNRRYAVLHARLRDAMARLIEREARAAGETLSASADDLVRAALALGTGTALERCVDGDAVPADLNERMGAAIVRGLGGAGGAAPPRGVARRSR